MSDQIEYAGFEASEFAENPEPRVPCVLLLDTSGSMAEIVGESGKSTGRTFMQDGNLYNEVLGETTRIDLLNQGLVTLKETLASDSLASRRAEIAKSRGWTEVPKVQRHDPVLLARAAE